MRPEYTLLRTRLTPPRLRRRVLARPGLTARLAEALEHRLTVVQAGTGYSKTTALAGLKAGPAPLYWYSVNESDADPQRFLSYLVGAFRVRLEGLPEPTGATVRERVGEHNRDAWLPAVDALLNELERLVTEPSLLVIDDFHLVSGSSDVNALLERFVTYGPEDLHVIVSSRYGLDWPALATWRARGDLLEIGKRVLAFSPEEIGVLFGEVYGVSLWPDELMRLAERTEGWPIALQLVWQGLREERVHNAETLLAAGSSLQTLFDYLANEVLGSQPEDLLSFLLRTCVLRELTEKACDAVTGETESREMLDRLLEMDLFVVDLGGGHYRYHHLFHDFLRQQAERDAEAVRAVHTLAGRYFDDSGNHEEAIYHWLAAGDGPRAAASIERAADPALHAGWLDTVMGWIEALPGEVLAAHPQLQIYTGDVYRMRSRFEEALGWYSRAEAMCRERGDMAEVGRALRGQALVYLDTVRPAEAESILQEAIAVTEGLDDKSGRARLLDLLAENKLNMGKPDEAEALGFQARALRNEGPGEDALSVRVKLRTGRLAEARRVLESWAEQERHDEARGHQHAPRAHRETMLMLSLISALEGDGKQAFTLAEEGIALGSRLHSPFVIAVGQTRLGHAWQLQVEPGEDEPGERAYEGAIRAYEMGVALGDRLAVRRMRAEAMWGLTRAYGFGGDLAAAERAAAEGVATGKWAGDSWIVALIDLMLGASYVLVGQSERATQILSQVQESFHECGDIMGGAASRLWLALAYMSLGQHEAALAAADECLALCEAHGYSFLFTRHSLVGPPDLRRLVPLLLAARDARRRVAYVNRLLAEMGLADVQVHPGYRLRVRTLGGFRVFRGVQEVEAREWQRDKARHLFQLFLSQRGRWLQRDEIVDRLWPALAPDAALRDFKVALNALNKAIEPARTADAPFAFIERDGTSYRVRPESDLWLDAVEFERECLAGLRLADAGAIDDALGRLQLAVSLYEGPYLPDAIYDDWSTDERERLLSLFLRAADRLAGLLVERGRYNEALDLCERILAQDPCWEGAYRWMMIAHAREGNHPLAARAYQKCAQVLHAELGVEPSPGMRALHTRLLESGDRTVTAL